MTEGDRVELLLPLRDIAPGVRGTILAGPGTAAEGWKDAFKIKFDGYERVRVLTPHQWLRRLNVLDLIVDAID